MNRLGRIAASPLLFAGVLLAGALPLAGCGGGHHAPVPPQDTALVQAARSGRQSLTFGRPKQAVEQYRHAFTLALARNDAEAISDCGYDLAVAQLADDAAEPALQAIQRTRDALDVRGAPGFAELDLVQAAALHRLGRDAEADPLAARAQATASDPATVVRASSVRGLIAYARGDQAGIVAALDRFGQPKTPSDDWQADHDGLTTRLDLLAGRYREAADLARHAAAIHRRQLHYHDMADDLALAAGAMRNAGRQDEAADLYLQAGESAAVRGDRDKAVPWLRQVLMPGADPDAQRTAGATLARLTKAKP